MIAVYDSILLLSVAHDEPNFGDLVVDHHGSPIHTHLQPCLQPCLHQESVLLRLLLPANSVGDVLLGNH